MYGYDPSSPTSTSSPVMPSQVQTQAISPVKHIPAKGQSTSGHILNLPVETRMQIYQYILPGAISNACRGTFWHWAEAPIWLTCSLIHNECISMLYSGVIFPVDLNYEDLAIHLLNIVQSIPGSPPPASENPFPVSPPFRNLALTRRFSIRLQEESVRLLSSHDSKTYAAREEALASRMSVSARYLCNFLQTSPEILELRIELNDHNRDPRLVLNPFLGLANVRNFTITSPKTMEDDFVHRLQVCKYG